MVLVSDPDTGSDDGLGLDHEGAEAVSFPGAQVPEILNRGMPSTECILLMFAGTERCRPASKREGMIAVPARCREVANRIRLVVAAGVLVALSASAVVLAGLEGARPESARGVAPLPYPMLGVMAGGPRDQYTYVWAEGALESVRMYLPAEVLVLRVVRQTPDKRVLLETAGRLGVNTTPADEARLPERQERDAGGVEAYASSFEQKNVEDQRRFDCKDVEVYDNGCFSYRHRGGTPQPGAADGLWALEALSADRSKQIADRFAAESGLLPEGCEFTGVTAGVSQNCEGQEIFNVDSAPPRVLSRRVTYTRSIGGVRLGTFVVCVNGRGEVYQVENRVPRFEPVARYPILSAEEARGMIPRGLLASHIWGPATAYIERISLSYSRDWGESGYLQPIYSFSGTAVGENGQTDTFTVAWPAIRPEHFAE
jgi:hypothetical protein